MIDLFFMNAFVWNHKTQNSEKFKWKTKFGGEKLNGFHNFLLIDCDFIELHFKRPIKLSFMHPNVYHPFGYTFVLNHKTELNKKLKPKEQNHIGTIIVKMLTNY